MADRRRDVVLLLGSLYDGLYLPPGALRSRAGFVPADREPCQGCGGVLLLDDFGKEIRRQRGRGWILDRFKQRQPCTGCGGRWGEKPDGQRVLERGAGWIARDPMDAQRARVGSEATGSTARPRRTVPCDACAGDGVRAGVRCARCGGEGRRDLHAFELHLDTRDEAERDPLLAAIEARNGSGSYRELERALAELGRAFPVRRRLVEQRYVLASHRHDSPVAERLVEAGLAYLVHRMPASVRVPADVRANARLLGERRTRAKGRASDPRARERRDREIVDHDRQGRSVGWIAAEYGLSVSAVYDVLRRRSA